MQEVKKKIENSPGFSKITYQVESGGPPVGKAINVRIVTDDNDRRTNVATEVYDYIKAIPGVTSRKK